MSVVVFLLALLIPPEATLGGTIRIVLLHGALARTGLVVFAAAAACAGLAVVTGRRSLYGWTWTLQVTAVVTWTLYFISSLIATKLTWGVALALAEPRTQASIKILIMAFVFLPLALWIAQDQFTAALNIVAGATAITLTRMAAPVQHPVNPVMDAGTWLFPALFVAMWVVLTLMAFVGATWLHSRRRPLATVPAGPASGA
jgi:hypothetical protein